MTETAYTAKDITVLEGLEPVRLRPGMYIGSTGSRGLHHLVYEVVDNAVDEALAGRNDLVDVTIHPDNSVTVKDAGAGIPVDVIEDQGLSALTVVLTKLHAGGKFGGEGYKVSGGLHGVGVSVVNALSEWLVAEVRRGGKVYRQEFARGEPTTDIVEVGTAAKGDTGTTISFLPDPEIFEETEFSAQTLVQRLREGLDRFRIGRDVAVHDAGRNASRRRLPIVERDRHQRRAVGPLCRDMIGMGDRLRHVLAARGFRTPLHIRLGKRCGVARAEKRIHREQASRLLARRDYERCLVAVGVVDVAERMADARRRMQIAERRSSRRPRVAVRHADDGGFLQPEHVTEIVRPTVEERELGRSRIAEHGRHLEGTQEVEDRFAHADAHGVLLMRLRTRIVHRSVPVPLGGAGYRRLWTAEIL